MMTETVVNVQEAPNNNAPNKPQVQQGATTTTTTNPDGPFSWIKLNFEYFKTVPGIIKIVQVILGIVCMSLASPLGHGGTHFFYFVIATSFIVTITWIFIYLLGVREAFKIPINWLLSEFLNTGICALAYPLASLIQIIVWCVADSYYGHYRGSNIAAGVLGLFNSVAFAAGAYLLHAEWKNSRTT